MEFPLKPQKEIQYLDGLRQTKWGMERDCQRQRVYNAEDAVEHKGKRFDNIHDLRFYVNTLVKTEWWRLRFSIRSIHVGDGRGRVRLTGYPTSHSHGVIKMPKWGRCPLRVLHEIAHVVTFAKPHAGHGRLFAAVYVLLVEHSMGVATRDDLIDAFYEHRVQWE